MNKEKQNEITMPSFYEMFVEWEKWQAKQRKAKRKEAKK